MSRYLEAMAEAVETGGDTANKLFDEYEITPDLLLEAIASGAFFSAVYGPITRGGEDTRLNSPLFIQGLFRLRATDPDGFAEAWQALGSPAA